MASINIPISEKMRLLNISNWRPAIGYLPRGALSLATPVPPPAGFTASCVLLNTLHVSTGIQATLGDINPEVDHMRGNIEICVDVQVEKGKIGLQVCQDDRIINGHYNGGASIFFSDAALEPSSLNPPLGQFVWIQPEPGRLFRTASNGSEQPTGGVRYRLYIQRSTDNGVSWDPPSPYELSAANDTFTRARYCYNGFYDSTDQVMNIFTFDRLPSFHTSMSLIKFQWDERHPFAKISDVPIPDDIKFIFREDGQNGPKHSLKDWYVFNEGRAIVHKTSRPNLWIYPLQVGSIYDGKNAMYENLWRAQMLVSSDKFNKDWQLIDGGRSGYRSGLREVSCVELSNGDVLFIGNSTGCNLLTMLWTFDENSQTFTPQKEQLVDIVSPESKHDVLKLSDGTIAMVYMANNVDHSFADDDRSAPRCVLILTFSDDDCQTWKDYHVVQHFPIEDNTNLTIYEPYLAEVDNQLRVDYFDGPHGPRQIYRTIDLNSVRQCRKLSEDCSPYPMKKPSSKITLKRVVPKTLISDSKKIWLKIVSEQHNDCTAYIDNIRINEL